MQKFIRFIIVMGVVLTGVRAVAGAPAGGDCPTIESSALLSADRFSTDEELATLAKYNARLEKFQRQLYCHDRRLYFDTVSHFLDKAGRMSDLHIIARSVVAFRQKFAIAPYGDELRFTKGDFRRTEWFDREFAAERALRNRGGRSSGKTCAANVSADFVLVAGYMNELFHDTYFKDFTEVLKNEFCVSPRRIQIVYTDSNAEAAQSVRLISVAMQNALADRSKVPLYVVGHSRGGLMALETLAEHPDLLMNPRFQRLVTLQSPLKGTPTATVAGYFWSFIGQSGRGQAADSMDSGTTHVEVQKLITHLPPEQLGKVSRSLFYVSTQSTTQTTKFGTYIISGQNDGTVPYASQYIRSFGRHLATLANIGHTDLVLDGLKSDLSENDRKSFFSVLTRALLTPNLDREDLYDDVAR